MSYEQPPAYGGSPAPGQTNPGTVLGIISIVLGVTGCLSIIGVVLGFLSRSRSKAAGASPTIGTVGLVISLVVTVIGIVVAVLIAAGVANLPWDEINEGIQQCEQGSSTYEVDGVTVDCP